MRHIIPKGYLSKEHKSLVKRQLDDLPDSKAWLVQVEPYKTRRTLEQNAFLHAVPIKLIADFTGHDKEDIKDHLLGEAFGWHEYEIMGQTRRRPMKRSSELNVEEFAWFLDWIEAWAAEKLDLVIPKPNEVIT